MSRAAEVTKVRHTEEAGWQPRPKPRSKRTTVTDETRALWGLRVAAVFHDGCTLKQSEVASRLGLTRQRAQQLLGDWISAGLVAVDTTLPFRTKRYYAVVVGGQDATGDGQPQPPMLSVDNRALRLVGRLPEKGYFRVTDLESNATYALVQTGIVEVAHRAGGMRLCRLSPRGVALRRRLPPAPDSAEAGSQMIARVPLVHLVGWRIAGVVLALAESPNGRAMTVPDLRRAVAALRARRQLPPLAYRPSFSCYLRSLELGVGESVIEVEHVGRCRGAMVSNRVRLSESGRRLAALLVQDECDAAPAELAAVTEAAA